jgi:ABC-type tungstate transport system permease subunit
MDVGAAQIHDQRTQAPSPNEYEMCLVNTAKHPNLKYHQAPALQFYDFLIGNDGQKIIPTFGVKEYGEPICYPTVIRTPQYDNQTGL